MARDPFVKEERVRRAVVVGGGIAGLMTTLELCRAGIPVLLVSLESARRAPSVGAAEGINAACDPEEVGGPGLHFAETIRHGEYLAHQPPVKAMTEAAPELVDLLDRMGLPFERTPEGLISFRSNTTLPFRSSAAAGDTTGQQLSIVLDAQVRRLETSECTGPRGLTVRGEPWVKRLERWDLLDLVRDDNGVVVGIVAQDLISGQPRAFAADAVCLATGGPGALFGRATTGLWSTGSAASLAFQAGAVYANGEFIEVHPMATAGTSKPHPIDLRLRAVGRLWVPKDPREGRAPTRIPESERDYFWDRLFATPADRVSDEVVARAIHRVCVGEGRGVFAPSLRRHQPCVYLDLTELDAPLLNELLATGPFAASRKLGGVDPGLEPIAVYPAVHYSPGGLWVDYEARSDGELVHGSPRNQATSLTGLYAVGECEYQYHGARRLPGNSLLSCLYAARVAGPAIRSYRESLERSASDLPGSLFERAQARAAAGIHEIMTRNQDQKAGENPFVVADELGQSMLVAVGCERDDQQLEALLAHLAELDERTQRVRLGDLSMGLNQSAQQARHLQQMIVLARVIVHAALRRQESRGTHQKSSLAAAQTAPLRRDDGNWLRTTLCNCQGSRDVRFLTHFDYACAGARVRVSDRIDLCHLSPPFDAAVEPRGGAGPTPVDARGQAEGERTPE